MGDFAKSWLEISRGALRHNASELAHLIAPAGVMAVIKANAYGHGLPEVVKALDRSREVRWYGVDSLEEALELRASGSVKPLLILGGVPPAGYATVVKAGFSLTVYEVSQLKALDKLATARRPAKVHVKIETGTSRQGVLRENWTSFARALRRCQHVVLEGMSTHYANIEDTLDPSYAIGQLRQYSEALAAFAAVGVKPQLRHTAASAAAMLHETTRMDLVRCGIALYGLWPSRETETTVRQRGLKLSLEPALTWKARVVQVKRLAAGTPVSYGLTEKVTRQSLVAVLPVGYYDGLPRALSSVGTALIRGRRAKILGRVCMNMCVVDVTDIPGVKEGDEAVLLGRQGSEAITAEEFAAKAGTINYEIVARLNPLTPRRLVA
jgi:alanine racemase